jgi:hypothetical protein
VYICPNIKMMNILTFHIETNYFFIKNESIFIYMYDFLPYSNKYFFEGSVELFYFHGSKLFR